MKKILLGMIIGTLLTVSTTLYASSSIQAIIFPAKIKVNGQEKHLDDGYQILNVNGHAYVPIRYVAENTGINVGYDDVSQTIYLAYGNTSIQDNAKSSISIGDLILTADKLTETTKVSGHLDLKEDAARYVHATLTFMDHSQNVIGVVTLSNDFQPGLNTFEVRGAKDFTGYSSVNLKVNDIHPAMKSLVESLFAAAKEKNQTKIKSIVDSIPPENKGLALLDFMKWSVPFDSSGRDEILPYLISKNDYINAQDKASGFTALMYASSYSINSIKPLIDAGADVKIKANDGTTALLLLASKNKPDLVKLYLDRGADPNVSGTNGYYPLLAALRPMFANYTEDTVTTIKYLIEAGAKTDIKDPEGNTLMEIIDDIPNAEVVSQLKALLGES
ncbi:stalk domain-containing protein [Paenibacillus ehimensis]|uniref:ankyrin repeat domain-containing protein n=1 Tax=Paenibacillus ehimensis TaxID=79264 RepID=UPI002B613233|nr:ankyrin repeat domain-containing protein [Paenibacillus ehimensis]MEC0208634.1 stalk domain-containing protein [Paenibacillus ehimensis]HWO95590.1 ankyrin repeat domain-containing protein [Bacillus sp. (in: firmicutes)]